MTEDFIRAYCSASGNPRAAWKRIYRTLRVCRREAVKAANDYLAFGTGVVLVPGNGEDVRCVPLREYVRSETPLS